MEKANLLRLEIEKKSPSVICYPITNCGQLTVINFDFERLRTNQS